MKHEHNANHPNDQCVSRSSEWPEPKPLPKASQRTKKAPSVGTRSQAIHVFSGPSDRQDGLASFLAKENWDCIDIDTVAEKRLPAGNDLLNDELWEEIEDLTNTGQVQAALMGPPCSTCSRARLFPPRLPRPIRSAEHPMGLPHSLLLCQRSCTTPRMMRKASSSFPFPRTGTPLDL